MNMQQSIADAKQQLAYMQKYCLEGQRMVGCIDRKSGKVSMVAIPQEQAHVDYYSYFNWVQIEI
jgi:Tfp pilus assembly protein PilP